MSITLNFNASASTVSLNLSRANGSLQASFVRLSSGKRVNRTTDDSSGLSVAYKIKPESSSSLAIIQKSRSALSYLQLQDTSLNAVSKIFDRMSELQTMARDIAKNSGDIENDSEQFVDPQIQIDQVKNHRFNGMSLFASNRSAPTKDGSKGTETYQRTDGSVMYYPKLGLPLQFSASNTENTVSINVVNLQFVTSYEVLEMSKVNLAEENGRFYANTINDSATSLFTHTMRKIPDAKAENGGEQNRMQHTPHTTESYHSDMEASHGRILDTDIAAESTPFARSRILVQTSTSMSAQANQLSSLPLTLIE